MCLFTILAIIIITLVAFVVITAGLIGGSFVIMFADIIVCIAIFVMIFKFLANRNK